jgi:hypothetical protein
MFDHVLSVAIVEKVSVKSDLVLGIFGVSRFAAHLTVLNMGKLESNVRPLGPRNRQTAIDLVVDLGLYFV